MDVPSQALSDIIVHGKYARWWGELGRRETFEEVVARNREMVVDQLYELPIPGNRRDQAQGLLDWAYTKVLERKVLPSMRSLQFAGEPIFRDPNRIYNCGFMQARVPAFFRELMFLLLGGSGIGYSVQLDHVNQLPPLQPLPRCRTKAQRYMVQDSVIGWADAVDALVQHYFRQPNNEVRPYPIFDYSEVRAAGEILVTSGGKAPGHEPLMRALKGLDAVLCQAARRGKLQPVEVHDMACIIADAVRAGGIRRSAMIALFSPSDSDMLHAKSGRWWELNPQRAQANNSVVLWRQAVSREDYGRIFDVIEASGSGEPGIFWTNDPEWGTNPCAEISLRDMQFCNLTTINAGTVVNQTDLEERALAAAYIGTIQATFTDFHYLRPEWRETTELEALIGVSMTGIASGRAINLDLRRAAQVAVKGNAYMARLLGINSAARVTTVKPEGTASLVLGTSSGIHAWHDRYYIRRTRFNKDEAIAGYLMDELPYREDSDPDPDRLFPLEDVEGKPDEVVLAVPQMAPVGAVTRDEGALALLDRVLDVTRRWVQPGHVSGLNTNNVSTTVNVRPEEWSQVKEWMWLYRHHYTGIATLPYDGGTYTQAPFETIDAAEYQALVDLFEMIDVTEIDEWTDYTNLAGEPACAGGACEVTWLSTT